MAMRRWQVWVSLVAGAWLFITPWVLGYTAASGGAWTAYILGALAVVVAVWTLAARNPRTGEASGALIGALAFVAPWVFDLTGFAWARLDLWIVGAVMVVASLWAYLDSPGARERRQPKPLA